MLKNNSADIEQYAKSVKSFFDKWANVAGGIDGHDIDYESSNVQTSTPKVLREVRTQLNQLGRDFRVTASPLKLILGKRPSSKCTTSTCKPMLVESTSTFKTSPLLETSQSS